MTPTQAQIDAALRAYSEAGAGHKGGMIAALTAAAQVGHNHVYRRGNPRPSHGGQMTTAIIVVGSVVLLVGLFVLIMRHLFSGWVDQ